jgi:peptide/nickel transport system substrate-binding protein
MTQQPPYRGSTCTRRRLLQGALGGAAGLTLWPWRVAHATAQPSGQLTVGVHVTLSPTWFDPAETPGIITPFMFLYALHDALVKPMPGKTLTPSLAESWSESPDGLTYEFLLRAGVTFHNGDPSPPKMSSSALSATRARQPGSLKRACGRSRLWTRAASGFICMRSGQIS